MFAEVEQLLGVPLDDLEVLLVARLGLDEVVHGLHGVGQLLPLHLVGQGAHGVVEQLLGGHRSDLVFHLFDALAFEGSFIHLQYLV